MKAIPLLLAGNLNSGWDISLLPQFSQAVHGHGAFVKKYLLQCPIDLVSKFNSEIIHVYTTMYIYNSHV